MHIVLCFVFRRLVYPMLPVSLDCPILIAPSVFYNVYLQFVAYLLQEAQCKMITIIEVRCWLVGDTHPV